MNSNLLVFKGIPALSQQEPFMSRRPRPDDADDLHTPQSRRQTRRQQRSMDRPGHPQATLPTGPDINTPKPRKAPPFIPKTEAQDRLAGCIDTCQITLALGPAGVGKTWVEGAKAAEAFLSGKVSKIILTRPAIEAGEKFGFLPGKLEDKYEPYLRPYRQVLAAYLGEGFLEYCLKTKKIEPLPLEFMRGMTFQAGWWVMLDEGQNVTPVQMKMFLTRIGDGCKVLVNGDLDQKDIPGPSGLADATARLRGLGGVGQVIFTEDDVVRSGIVREILRRYAKPL